MAMRAACAALRGARPACWAGGGGVDSVGRTTAHRLLAAAALGFGAFRTVCGEPVGPRFGPPHFAFGVTLTIASSCTLMIAALAGFEVDLCVAASLLLSALLASAVLCAPDVLLLTDFGEEEELHAE